MSFPKWTLIALCSVVATPALSQPAAPFPAKPMRLVVPFPPGSVTDIASRIVAQKLGGRLGQQVVVENRVGASGGIGVEVVAKAAPDGYTMGLITASTHGLAPALGAKLPYDTVRDFKPVSMIGEAPYVLVIHPGIPAKTVSELVAHARTKPGHLNYGSAGTASIGHLAAALLALRTSIDITHVPYKSTAQSAVDIIAGRLDMQIATVAPTLSSIRDGKMRALATTGKRRMAALPEVPTMIESGVKDYAVALWMAFAAPAATPDAIVQRLNSEMTASLNDAETAEALRKQGLEPEPGPPSLVSTRIREEIETWRTLIAKTGIKAE